MNIKNQILNLFLDNISGDIVPKDMRTFVTNIFDSKENIIRKVTDSNNLIFIDYPIKQNDLVVINEANNRNSRNGLYLAKVDNPTFNYLELISSEIDTNNILSSGKNNEILATINGVLTWVPQKHGYYLKGTKNILDILAIRPVNIGEVFIAQDTQPYADVPGSAGDGYSWDGDDWINVGPLVGPAGPAADVSNLVTKEYLTSAEYGNSLPITDPSVIGMPWNDNGFIKISQ